MNTLSIEKQLHQQTRLQEMLMDIASTYISMPVDNLNESIEATLGAIGRFVAADRVYIFEYDFAAGTGSNTFEWCEQGIDPQIDALQQIPMESAPEWLNPHLLGQTVYIPDVLALDESSHVRNYLEPQNIKSLIAVPMMHGDQCVGFVGLDSVRHHYNYSTTEQRLLVLFAQMLVNVFMRRDTELALREAKELAQASSKAKSAFLANMSHEIRTPLNAVIGFTDLLLTTQLTPIQQQYVVHANASGQVLLGIVNDILDLSKIEASQLNLELSEADLLETVREALAMVQHLADQKQLQLQLSWMPSMPTRAKFDTLRLSQVLVNLLSNAVKFTERGEVVLHMAVQSLSEGRGRFRFSVQDTGIGISAEQRPLLFNAFAQADNSTTRRYGGTGLGLAISKLLVEKMGGQLDFESTPGQGATFWIEMELELPPTNGPEQGLDQGKGLQGAEQAGPKGTGLSTVLVVEDVLTNRMLINAQLRQLFPDVNILEACDGQESIEVIQQNQIDLVLMDIHMPTMDGITATRQIRLLDSSKNGLPIVALTASALEEERERCMACGMNDFLTKPVRRDLLEKVVSHHLFSATIPRPRERGDPWIPGQAGNDHPSVVPAKAGTHEFVDPNPLT